MEKDDLNQEIICFNCNKKLELKSGANVIRNEECPYCYASIHSCKMCNFHDPKVYNSCHEPEAERIVDKEKANYCDFFILYGNKEKIIKSKEENFNAANALFKK